VPSPELLITHADAPAAPALPVMPPSGRISSIVEDLGLAMGGLRNRAYCAFAWRWARDDVARTQLEKHLPVTIEHLRFEREWPMRMRGELYLHKLSWLAIWEEHNWWWIRVGEAWPLLINMDEELWKHRVAEKYEVIRSVLDCWCEEARSHAQRRSIDLAPIDQRLALAKP
jgi:hypothetical protein